MVPKLRFKEFCGEWEEKRLGDIYEFKNGLNKEKEFFGKGTPIVNYMDVNKNTHLYKNTIKGRVQLTKKEIENYSAKKGDLFFTRTSETIDEIGYTAVLLDDIEDAVFSGFILRARPKNELIDFKFSGYCFMTREVRKEIIKKSSMTTRALTSGTSLKQVAFYLPSLPEQTKIADFLSTVDDKIQNQEDKITHLENIKKGFMQKIFSRKIRFKDDGGEEFPEWEEKKLGDISYVNQGLQISIKNRFLEPGKNRYFYITNEFLKENSKTVYYIEDPPKSVICSKDDVLMTRTGNTGKIVTNVKGAYHNNFFKINYDRKVMTKQFLVYLLSSDKLQKRILTLAGNSTIPDLNHKDFYNIKVDIPYVKEQQKIADFLSSFDEKISIEKEILEHLKQLKKGLLQQMFI